MKILNQTIVTFFLVSMLGCGGWSYISKPATETVNKKYTFQLPQGWMKIKFGSTFTMTRDATSLQSIKVSFHEKKKAFEKIKKEFPNEALPFEIAELYLAEYKANNEGINIELVENSPFEVAGEDGFKLKLKTQSNSGVNYQIVITGFATKDGLYTLSYEAPTIRYFELDIEQYKKLTKSMLKKV